MPDLVIKGGTVIDSTGERRADVVVADGAVVDVGPDLSAATTLDAGGCVVSPGLVDLHANLREPGQEEAETIESGTRAAVLGGFTAVVAMPSTSPPIDNAAVLRDVQQLTQDALCEVQVAGSITVGQAGERLSPMAEMAALGVRLFSDDQRGVQDARLMRRALEYASGLDVTLAQHCDTAALSDGGHMHEGAVSSLLGIPGIPAEAEELMVMRDVALSRLTGARVHLQHLSTAGSLGIFRAAKAAGIPVSAEVAPHHLALTDEEVRGYDPRFKVAPPLRPAGDVEAVKAALADGLIDAIATDHSPHEPHQKELPFDEAPTGMVGLELALSVAITELDLPLADIIGLLSWRPAQIAGVVARHGGPIQAGGSANLTVIDPAATWVVEGSALQSRGSSTGFAGRELTGRVRHTIVAGEPIVVDAEALR